MTWAGDATVATVVDDLTRRGFTEHFEVVQGRLRGAEGGRTYRADELTIREVYRFEGVSDPDDLSVVYAIEGRDGTRGTLVDAFGVYADPGVAGALASIPIRRAA